MRVPQIDLSCSPIHLRYVLRKKASDEPDTLLGLGDGGPHVGIMCDATTTNYTLTHWTRERGLGALFPVP
jgi:N-acyl-D-aspartate/D-glutamate deacylase